MKLNQNEFSRFQQIILDESGISVNDSKIDLLNTRLYSRLIHYKIKNFSSYLNILEENIEEKVEMINLVTTNETYFFREHLHFDFLTSLVKKLDIDTEFKVWSAASSIGAEAYSIAMVLDGTLHTNKWQIIGSDINTDVIKKAKKGLYNEALVDHIPSHYKIKYCLKGKDKYEGKFIIDKKLKDNITFYTNNLTIKNNDFGMFDIIFLRNVLIYFNLSTRQQVLDNVLQHLKPNGYLIISLTENFDGLDTRNLIKNKNSIYQRIK